MLRVIESLVGIEPHQIDHGVDVVEEQRIAQAEQHVDRVGGRAFDPPGEAQVLLEKLPVHRKVQGRGYAFIAAQGIQVLSCLGLPFRPLQFLDACLSTGGPLALAEAELDGVADFPPHDRLGEGQAKLRVLSEQILTFPEIHSL